MSITNSDLISDALREISVLDETETASAEQFADAIKKLNQMMERWDEEGINIGYFTQTITSDSCPIPVYAEQGVTSMLAVRLAATYAAKVTQELIASADSGYQTILRNAMNDALNPATMANRPRADARVRASWNILKGP